MARLLDAFTAQCNRALFVRASTWLKTGQTGAFVLDAGAQA